MALSLGVILFDDLYLSADCDIAMRSMPNTDDSIVGQSNGGVDEPRKIASSFATMIGAILPIKA